MLMMKIDSLNLIWARIQTPLQIQTVIILQFLQFPTQKIILTQLPPLPMGI